MPVTPLSLVDDDGSGLTGTLINVALLRQLETNINAAILADSLDAAEVEAAITARIILASGQTAAPIRVRGAGNRVEWGHTNAAGYGNALGSESGSGKPFVAFHAEAGATANTYLTRGIPGVVLRSDAAGSLLFGTVPTASADNQAPVDVLSIGGAGKAISSATQPRASAYLNGTQSIPDGAWTTILMDSEDLDVGGCHDNTTNTARLTVPAGAGGLYLVIASIHFAAVVAGLRGVRIMKNAAVNVGCASTAPGTSGAGAGTAVQAVSLAVLAAAEYVYMDALQTSGAALNAGMAGNRTFQCTLQFVKLW